MIWHYHDDDVAGPAAEVDLQLAGLPPAARQARQTHYRIDEDHSNAFVAWKRMGSPQPPTTEQYAALEKASQLATVKDPNQVRWESGAARLRVHLPRQGVSLVVLEWPP
jgi:xylan 1,4-beta-xylosidase